jgi:sporulation protein YlmC with PRC-barrel domain
MHRVSDLRGLTIAATDGDIGSLDDVYFDSRTWRIRYLVVDTGTWLAGRRVSVAPHVAQVPDLDGKRLPVALTRAQVEGSPDVSTTPPVSRQQEIAWHAYYGYPLYWATPDLLGTTPLLAGPDPRTAAAAEELAARESGEAHLHSAQEVRGFYIGAADGDVGHVADFLVDVESWTIRYLVVDTSNWWTGKHVLIAPGWITDVSWDDSKVYTTLTQAAIKSSPEYDLTTPVQREYERRLYGHYRRPSYWE